MPDRCRSCLAKIEWAVTEKGRRMPVDPVPVPNGNIILSHREQGRPPIALYQSAEQIKMARRQAEAIGNEAVFFLSHFVTCPNAKKHRKSDRTRSA